MDPDLSRVVRQVPGGVELSVFCQPNAARSALVGTHGGALKAKVKALAVEGRANRALLDLLAAALAVPAERLTLVSGERSRNKRVRADGLDPAAAIGAILAALVPRLEGRKNPPDVLDGNGV